MKLKRTAAALTAAAMLPLCACQSAPPQVQLDPSSPTAIEIWHYYNGAQKEAFDSLQGAAHSGFSLDFMNKDGAKAAFGRSRMR